MQQALDGLAQAHAAWTAAEQDVAALVRLAGQETRDVARFPAELGELMRHARRVGDVEVPAPLPRALQPVTVAAFDDPDPAVREAARGQIAREAAA